jgi:hypothetical protein
MEKSSSKKDIVKIPEKGKNHSSNIPNQYAKVKNTVKGEEDLQVKEQDYGFIVESLEEEVANTFESQ